jgi:hypothetical protein
MLGNNTRKLPLCSYLYLKLAKMSCFSFENLRITENVKEYLKKNPGHGFE